jgi:hypothetical protein
MALKESSLREERLWPSAQKIKAGEGSREAHAELVNTIKPVRPYAQPVPPASDEEVHDALSKDKKPNAFAPRDIPKGMPVAVRLDIPAYEQKNTWVVSVHQPKSDFTAGSVIGYDSVAHIDNPRFGVHPTGALNIASGKPKSTIATVHGNWRSTTPEKAYALAQTIHSNPEWRQVGMDPERHSYFYDRETQQPVIAADEALHIGPLVYAKNPVYDKPENYKFADGGAADYIPHDDKRRAKNLKDFHGKTPKEIKEARWYHGTNQDFSTFQPRTAGAIYLTRSPEFAEPFTKQHMEHWHESAPNDPIFGWGSNSGPEKKIEFDGIVSEPAKSKSFKPKVHAPNIMPVHIRAEKPFDYENRKHIAALYEELGPDLIMDPYLLKFMDEVREGHWGALESDPIQSAIKAMGHDSFYVKENGVKNLGVYDPSQIKSATGNQGTFDQSNPDITKKRGGTVETKPVDVDHPNFRSWFGNSVLHDEGKPVRYYHGTSKDTDFKKFNMSRHGVWLTSDPDSASSYAKENDSQKTVSEWDSGKGGLKWTDKNTASRVIPVYAKIENPFTGDRPEFNTDNYKKAQSDWFDVLRSQGYDGWVPAKHQGQLAVALSRPDQVKSAISNTGDYSENPEIHKAGGGALDDEDEGITAYHGSPHDFEQFDTSKIGTGEGAQVYGHGLYFAGNEDVAKSYRDNLSSNKPVPLEVDGERFEQPTRMQRLVEHHFGDVDTVLKKMEPNWEHAISTHFAMPDDADELERMIAEDKAIEAYKERAEVEGMRGKTVKYGKPGHMYEVHIDAHPDHFLNWDAPLDSHPEVHSRIIQAVRDKAASSTKNKSAWSSLAQEVEKRGDETFGHHLQDALIRPSGIGLSPKEASDFLSSAGVHGIKYLDAGSRDNNQKRTQNYVVFDHDRVAVKRKYARGGVVG